ncbi:MAG: hypothetical protein AAF623_00755 [Planctomycetota bacterium]
MKSLINSIFATCGFELRRSMTFQRTAVSIVLSLFPPTMLGLLIFGSIVARSRMGEAEAATFGPGVQEISKVLTILMVALITLLSLLLWATPNVSSELEGKSWSFLASRPGGRISVFLGKYLASFLITFFIATIAYSICVLLCSRLLGLYQPERLWFSMAGIYFLASAVYAAIFSLIGTIFIKRAMVFAAGYVIGSEIILASLPGALINKFTIRFHLQELGIQWIGWFLPGSTEAEFRDVFGPSWPPWIHVGILFTIASLALAIGSWVIVSREYVISDEA